MQRTVVLLKPDSLQRGLVGEIITRFEKKGLKLVGLKLVQASEKLLGEHYVHHKGKPFFGNLVKFMMSTPLVAILLEGVEAVAVARKMVGSTNGRDAEFGTIRGDLSISQSNNLIHVSDSLEVAAAEERRFFAKGEVFDWDRIITPAIYGEGEVEST